MDRKTAQALLRGERDRLEQLKASLVTEASNHENGAGIADEPSAGQHPVEVAPGTFEREKAQSVIEGIDAELALIERAEQKLAEKAYGTCEACGKPIADARLEARPAARFCVEDRARLEREGRLPG